MSSAAASARRTPARAEHAAVRWVLLGLALGFIFLFLLLPLAAVFVEAFRKANNNMRPNFMAVGAYDGMQLIYKALEKTKGNTDGEGLIAAMKGMSWTSVRGPVSIDPDTRDIVQNIYVRKVEKVGTELYNQEFSTIEAVKDPFKAAKK